MNAYVFDTFITHSIVMENFEEDGIYTTYCDLVEVGPLNIMDLNNPSNETCQCGKSKNNDYFECKDCGKNFCADCPTAPIGDN